MTATMIVLFLAACAGGAVVQSVGGFGFGILVMSVFPYILPSYGQAIAVTTLLSVVLTVSMAIRYRKQAVWQRIVAPFISFVIVSTLIARFTAGAQDVLLRRMLGVLLIALSVYFIFFNGKITLRPTIVNGLIVGALCGVTNVLFGIGGPPVVIYLLAVSQSKEAYQGTVQAYFALSDLYTLALRISGGLVTGQVLGLWGLGLLALGAGLVVGRMVFQRLKPATVRKLVYAVMALSGVTLLFAR